MNFNIEMKKSLQAFGEPLTVLSDKNKTTGVGLFTRYKQKHNKKINTKPLNDNLNSYCAEKFSLWLYSYTKINKIDTIITKNEDVFEILTGYYDNTIGCWRLIVQKCPHISNQNLNKEINSTTI